MASEAGLVRIRPPIVGRRLACSEVRVARVSSRRATVHPKPQMSVVIATLHGCP